MVSPGAMGQAPAMSCRALLLVTLLSACGESPPPQHPEAPPPEPGARKLAGMKVYDADNDELACEEPQSECPPVAPDADFEERCRLAGFRVQRCGCDALCTGPAEKRYYDAEGNAKSCAPQGDCAPPAAKAEFQDACTDRGFKLEACGCEEWLCSGDPSK
jgi:hypothetical protein